MESAIYSLFVIDIRNLVQNKLFICKEFHVQPSEIDRMPFYEYEYILEDIDNYQKRQQKDEEARAQEYNAMQSQMKMPNMNSFKMPKVEIPKF